MLKKIIAQWKNIEEPQAIDWLLLGSVGFLCLISVAYFDILTTAPQGIHLWDTQFYNYYSKIKELTGHSALYPFGIYLIFALWNFPVWLYAKLNGIIYMAAHSHPMQLTELGTGIILWNKLLLILFLLWTAWLIFRLLIEAEIPKGRAKWGAFIFLTSINTLSPVMLVSQYDILYIPFMLLGFLAFMRNQEKGFIAYFALALLMKGFSIFAFIPLLLLREKNIYKISLKAAASFIPYALLSFFFLLFDGAAYKEGLSFSKAVLAERLSQNFLGGTSFFIITYGFLCLYAYLQAPKSDKRTLLWQAAFLATASYALFFIDLNLWFHYYWIVLIAPFTTLLIFSNPQKLRVNLLLEALLSFGLMLYIGNLYSWMFGVKQINSMNILPGLFPVSGIHPYTSLADIIPNGMDHIYRSLFTLGLIALIIINFPRTEPSKLAPDPIERDIVWLRLAAFLPFILGLLFCYFYTGRPLG